MLLLLFSLPPANHPARQSSTRHTLLLHVEIFFCALSPRNRHRLHQLRKQPFRIKPAQHPLQYLGTALIPPESLFQVVASSWGRRRRPGANRVRNNDGGQRGGGAFAGFCGLYDDKEEYIDVA